MIHENKGASYQNRIDDEIIEIEQVKPKVNVINSKFQKHYDQQQKNIGNDLQFKHINSKSQTHYDQQQKNIGNDLQFKHINDRNIITINKKGAMSRLLNLVLKTLSLLGGVALLVAIGVYIGSKPPENVKPIVNIFTKIHDESIALRKREGIKKLHENVEIVPFGDHAVILDYMYDREFNKAILLMTSILEEDAGLYSLIPAQLNDHVLNKIRIPGFKKMSFAIIKRVGHKAYKCDTFLLTRTCETSERHYDILFDLCIQGYIGDPLAYNFKNSDDTSINRETVIVPGIITDFIGIGLKDFYPNEAKDSHEPFLKELGTSLYITLSRLNRKCLHGNTTEHVS